MQVKTLTDFKRYLSNSGKIKLISVYGQPAAKKISGIRTVEKMQSKNCKFVGGSWLEFPKAKNFKTKDNQVYILDDVKMDNNGNYKQDVALIYELID